MKQQPTAIDLFSGAGGLSEGLKQAGLKILLATDYDKHAATTYRHNHPETQFIEQNINDLSSKEILKFIHAKKNEIDLVAGGPPCQGFSTAGKKQIDDPRNKLFRQFLRVVKDLQPHFFLMENVKGLVTKTIDDKGTKMIDLIMKQFKKLNGYNIAYQVVNAASYGVPQFRERVIIMGNRLGYDNDDMFPLTTNDIRLKQYITVEDAIGDLATNYDEFFNHSPINHSGIVVERMSLVQEGGGLPKTFPPGKEHLISRNFKEVFRRLDRSKPAPTIVPGHSGFPIHPTLNRFLTVREAARIQSFPDRYKFIGPRNAQGLQVGNSVPPLLAKAFGLHIIKLLKQNC